MVEDVTETRTVEETNSDNLTDVTVADVEQNSSVIESPGEGLVELNDSSIAAKNQGLENMNLS